MIKNLHHHSEHNAFSFSLRRHTLPIMFYQNKASGEEKVVSESYVTMIHVVRFRGGVERIGRIVLDQVELDHDRRLVPRLHLHYVLPCLLVRRYLERLSLRMARHVARDRVVLLGHARLETFQIQQSSPFDGMKRREMNVQRVVVLRQVNHLPRLGATGFRSLGRRICRSLPVDIQMGGISGRALIFIQHYVPMQGLSKLLLIFSRVKN